MWIQQDYLGCFKVSAQIYPGAKTLYPFSHGAPYSMWLSGQP